MAYQPNNGPRLTPGPAWVDYSTVRTYPALEQKSSWFEQNILDPMRSFGSGSNSLLSGAGWLAEQMGAEDFGGAIQEFAQHGVDYWQSSLTPETQESLKKDLFEVTDQGVDFNFTKLVNGVAGSAPSFVVGLGAGGVLAKGLQLFANPLGRTALVEAINAGKAAGPGTAVWATAESAAKSLQFVDNLIGIGGYGASEGAMAGAAVGAEVSNTIKAMDHKTLSEKSERYRTLYDSYAGETEERRQQLAKGALADEASTDAGWKSGLATAVLGAPAGAFFGRILGPSSTRLWAEAEKFAVLRGSRLGAAVEGFATEGISEAAQSGSEQMFTNLGIQQADETKDTWEGVGAAAIEGGIIGGVLGGGVGAVAGNEHTQQAQIDSEKEADQRNTDRLIATSLEAIKGHGLDDYAARILEAQPERGRLQTLSDLAYMAENGEVRDDTLEELFPDLGADAGQEDSSTYTAKDADRALSESDIDVIGDDELSAWNETRNDGGQPNPEASMSGWESEDSTGILTRKVYVKDPTGETNGVFRKLFYGDWEGSGRGLLAEDADGKEVPVGKRSVQAAQETVPAAAGKGSLQVAPPAAEPTASTESVPGSETRFSLRESSTDGADGIASLNGVAEVGEPIGNSILANAKLFGDGPEALAAVSKGFQGVDRDTQGVVLSRVISALDDKEVVRAVIESVPIDVMNSLIGEKGSADLLRGNKTVLASRLSIPGNKPVPVSVVRVVDALASSLKQGLATGGAKESGLAGAPTLSGEGGSAVGAGKDGWHGAVAGRDVKVNPTPTPKQIEAGNWQKGHVRLKGLEISVENLLGSTRTLAKRAGSIQMQDHYGYVRGFQGADGDQLDVYVKDTDDDSIERAPIFAVEQLTPDGKFDEHKVYMGYESDKDVRASFLAHQQLKPAMRMSPKVRKFSDVAEFKQWAREQEQSHQARAAGFEFVTGKDGRLQIRGDLALARQRMKDVGVPTKGSIKRDERGEYLDVTPAAASATRAAITGRESKGSRAGAVVAHSKKADATLLGAPPKYNTERKMKPLRALLKKLALEGEPGRFWYEQSSQDIMDFVGGNKADADLFAKLLAIYSPQAKVDSNTTFAIKAFYQLKAGLPVKVKTAVMDRKAQAAADGAPLREWMGEKTNNFYVNLMLRIDPKKVADLQGATIDMWMMRAFEYESDAPTATQYHFAEVETNRLARELGWEPQQVQAAIWVAMKARTENKGVKDATEAQSEAAGDMAWVETVDEDTGKKKSVRDFPDDAAAARHRRRWLDNALAHVPTKEDTAGAGFHFGNGLRAHASQLSWEATPSKNVAEWSWIHGNMAAKMELQARVRDAIGSSILRTMNLMTEGATFGFGGWEGVVSPSSQEVVVAGSVATQVEGLKSTKRAVMPAIAKRMDAAAAIYGMLLRQDGVAWHRPFFSETVKSSNGVHLEFGRSLTAEETATIYNALVDVAEKSGISASDAQMIAPIPHETGVRFLNFGTYENNADFHKAVAAAAEKADIGDADLRRFRSDGNLVQDQDNGGYKDGQGYRQRILDAGFGDQLGRIESALVQKIDAVYADVAAKYGPKQDVRFRLREGSAGPARDARGAQAEQGQGGVTPPKFTSQKIQKDAVSAVGIHYGKAGLKALDPTMAGTGAAGGERRRLGMGRFGLTNPRVNFYIREPGEAVPPSEAVVGGAESYQVELMNLYDYDADPRGFFAKYPNNVDMVEEEVTDAGFDGILFPKHPQIPVRTAIVFGFKRKIPVVPAPASEPVMDLRYSLKDGDRETSAQKPKSPEVKTGLSAKAVQGLVNTLNWAGKDKIRVFESESDLPSHLQQLVPESYRGRVQGFYDPASKSVVVVSRNIDSPEEAYRTIVEEHLRHEGMRRFFTPAKMDQFLDGIYSALPQEGLRSIAKTYSADLATTPGKRLAAEEYIAKMRLDQERSPLMARVGDWVRGQLRSLGFKMAYSNRDVIHILQQIEDGVRSGRIASPAWNGVGDDPVAPMYSLSGETDRWYYSAMLRSVETGTGAPKRASATQWKQWLDGAQRRGEFKQAERDWIGVDEWLEGRGETTRAELVDFVNSNQVVVEETVLSNDATAVLGPMPMNSLPEGFENGAEVTLKSGAVLRKMQARGGRWYVEKESGSRSRWLLEDGGEDDADATIRDEMAGEEVDGQVKFDSYQLPGGHNYRELLLTMPSGTPKPEMAKRPKVVDRGHDENGRGQFDVVIDGVVVNTLSTWSSAQDLALQIEEEANIDRNLDWQKSQPSKFNSSHFDQPNILAHVRFNERTDGNGKRVLFVEEVQSDWHQEGRKKGYSTGVMSEEESLRVQKDIFARFDAGQITREQRNDELSALSDARQGLRGVPDAPLKKEWPLTAMKRMIRWAAENGFDRIAWTTGRQQGERYSIRNVVNTIRKDPPSGWTDNRFGVSVNMKNGTPILLDVKPDGTIAKSIGLGWQGKQLSDVLGKDVADKVLSAEPGIIKVDAEVGGEGMIGFYDGILPAEVGRYVKKFGASVTQAGMRNSRGVSGVEVMNSLGIPMNQQAAFWANADRDELIEQYRNNGQRQPSIDITPAMRQAALAGQPLFRLRDVAGTMEQESARRFISGPRPAAMSLGDRARVLMRDIYRTWTKQNALEIEQGLFDSGASIKDWEKRLTGALQDASESAGKMYDLARNPAAVLASVMRTGVPKLIDGAFQPVAGRKGLIDVFRPLYEQAPSGTTLVHLWEDYAAARRSSRLITEQNRDGTSREKQLSQEQIDELLKLDQQYPIFKQVFDDWQTFNSQMLDFAVENGVLSAQMRKMWAANDYVPFYRVIEELTDQAAGNSSSSRLTGRQVRSKRLTGGVGVIEPIFESIVKNSAYVLDSVYKNETMKRTVKMLAGHALTRAPMSFQPVRFNAGQIEKALQNAGIAMMSERDVKPGGSYRGQLKNLTQAELDQWNTMFTMVAPAGSNVVSVMIDGKAQYYFVDDPLLLRSIQAIGPQSMSHLMKFMSGGKELLTNLVTTDPGFMAVNFLRDTISAWVTSSAPFKPVLDGFKGAMDSWKDDPLRWKLQTAGASLGGYYDTRGADAYAAMELDAGAAPKLGLRANWRRWQRFGAHFENANRMAIARAIIDSGGTVAEAAYQAQDIMNFSMHGDSKSIRALTMTVPFMNARLQGLYRLWRGRNAASFWQRGAIVMGATLALMFKNWDDDRYWELEEFERDAYWHFWLGDEHIKIAKPFEVGQIFGTIWERAAATAFGPDTARLMIQRMGSMAFDTFAMNPVPQIVKPIIEQYANKNSFTGRPIENQSLQGMLPEQRYMPWTSESARVFAAALPDWAPAWLRSPVRVEALVRGYMGTLGLYALQASDQIARPLGGFGEPPAMALKDMPVVRRFYGGDTATRTKYEEPIYKLLDIANETRKSVMELRRRGDVEGANEIAQSNADILAARGRLNAFSTQMRALNMQERSVWNSSFTAEEKKVKIDALRARRNDMLRQSAELLEKLDPYLPYL